MNHNDVVLEGVRRADPLDALEVLDWSSSEDARLVLERVTNANVVALPAARRRHAIPLVIAAVAVTGGLSVAAAAAGVLGRPAPDRVRQHLAALDHGMPEDLRLNPDLEHARAVAATSSGALYAANLKGGGYCLEVVTEGDRPRGAVCVTAAHLLDRAIEVTAPIASETPSALLVGGRINDERVERVVVRSATGRSTDVTVGLERYWLFEVPPNERDDALNQGLVVAGLDADGRDVFRQVVPPLRDDDPTGTRFDHSQPIFVSTISTGDDLTLVVGVEGSVNVANAATLELQYPDGVATMIPIGTDGAYRYVLPADRQDDFARATGRVIARNAAGEILATAPISSVANSKRNP